MKSTTDGVKHYSKGVKVNARRKGALKRLENNLISIINLKENSDKQLKIINSNEELLISETEHIESLRDSILYSVKNIKRIEKEIEILKSRIY